MKEEARQEAGPRGAPCGAEDARRVSDVAGSVDADGVVVALREARAMIEKGWCQGDYRMGDKFCALGALRYALFNRPSAQNTALGWLSSALRFRMGIPHYYSLVDWNDHPDRTQADVLELYDKTLEMLETTRISASPDSPSRAPIKEK